MYNTLKYSVRAALYLYCGRIRVEHWTALPAVRPVLFACNHPNSFFDALLLATHVPMQVHFLTRGDVFRNPMVARILGGLNMIPIFRMSEGRGQLHRTERSFERAMEIFKKGHSLLIFSEGISVNEDRLRPLGKGTARIASRAWHQAGISQMEVFPVWFRYASFHKPYPEVFMGIGQPIVAGSIRAEDKASSLKQFNNVLEERLLEARPKVDPSGEVRAQALTDPRLQIGLWLLAIPALLGIILHALLYLALRAFVSHRTSGTIFYDSVLLGSLIITYPFWCALLVVLGWNSGMGAWSLLLLLALPLSALSLRHFVLTIRMRSDGSRASVGRS